MTMATEGNSILISILSPDRVGLIAEVAGELYGLGANLADASFAVLGRACEFSCVAELPAGVDMARVEECLHSLRSLEEAEIRISPFPFAGDGGDLAEVSHMIEIEGGDRPGLIARLSEVFMQFGANVVRMNSRRHMGEGGSGRYVTSFAVSMPPGRAESCLAAVHNTAGQLNLRCHYRTASQ